MITTKEQMNIVVVGHVDHGKSTVIGRLLADTGSLPQGKLDKVKIQCEKNARVFEYAFLLDALKDEQSQGITIDSARCFFKTKKRDYIIIDAPGHVEFLKNMVSGATRAEAALLLIDAHEGIAENSKRHGYLISMLGIRQLVILVNKMDLIEFDKSRYDTITREYDAFLSKLGMNSVVFIPISARHGDNLAAVSTAMPWYTGPTVLQLIDSFEKQSEDNVKPFRFPVQDIYKFTELKNDKRIIAGTVETGTIKTGDAVVFMPSGKRTFITSIEGFNEKVQLQVSAGRATGFTLKDELFLKHGEIMCRDGEVLPQLSNRFRANIFWMGHAPLVTHKKYKLKLGTGKVQVRLVKVISCIDATELSSISGKKQVDRHDVAECIFETGKPIAFDTIEQIAATARFVIVDNYDIAGGGIILRKEENGTSWLSQHIAIRERTWDKGKVSSAERLTRNGHRGMAIIVCGEGKQHDIAKDLEKTLFYAGLQTYFMSPDIVSTGIDSDLNDPGDIEANRIAHLGEVSRILTDAGLIFITALRDTDESDLLLYRELNKPNEVLVIWVGSSFNVETLSVDHILSDTTSNKTVRTIIDILRTNNVVTDYQI